MRASSGTTAIDPSGRAPGRGAYLHADLACIEQAVKRRALERALGGAVTADTWGRLRALA